MQPGKPERRRLSRRTVLGFLALFVLTPLTMLAGITLFDDRSYYLVSMLIILYTFVPFVLLFERRRPQARELVVLAVLCAVGVIGRGIFFFLPQFKPVAFLVIIAGVCFGGESGFLVGAVTTFVSNMMFGQGPWTPWQMFCFGLIGFLAGVLFRRGRLPRTPIPLAVYGGVSVMVIYGGLMNPSSLLYMPNASVTWATVLACYASGLPFDAIHAGSTVIFLLLLSKPLVQILERIQVKYGMLEAAL